MSKETWMSHWSKYRICRRKPAVLCLLEPMGASLIFFLSLPGRAQASLRTSRFRAILRVCRCSSSKPLLRRTASTRLRLGRTRLLPPSSASASAMNLRSVSLSLSHSHTHTHTHTHSRARSLSLIERERFRNEPHGSLAL